MVLNKSKWDHKAKVQYLRKHNLMKPKAKPEPQRKWSAKKSVGPEENLWLQQIRNGEDNDDDDEEWTVTDDVILNHFYPNISEDNISVHEKRKLKTQIIGMIRSQVESQKEGEAEGKIGDEDGEEVDGIYLGTRPAVQERLETSDSEPEPLEIADLETKLDEFIISDFGSQKPRSLLKQNLPGNLLEEYGMQDYQSTVKDHDYTIPTAPRAPNLDHYSANELHGFKIGQSLDDLKQKPVHPQARMLNADELEEHAERTKKSQDARFHDQIKKKFGKTADKPPKYLEINNFNPNDARQMSFLNNKISHVSHPDPVSSQDLDDLLGYTQDDMAAYIQDETKVPSTNPLELLDQLEASDLGTKKSVSKPKRETGTLHAGPSEQKFLDDLLGL